MMSTRAGTDVEALDVSERASVRLRGTVWEHVRSAHVFYRGCLLVGSTLGRAGITANALTYASLGLALLAGVAAAMGQFGWAAALVVLSGAFDLLDGVVARATNTASTWGALLDSTVDRLSDAVPLLGVAVFYADHGAAVLAPAVAIVAGFTVSYVRARAEGLGVTLPPLFMRRAERVVLVTASLLLGLWPMPGPVRAPLLLLGVSVMALLSSAGVVSALRSARQELLSREGRRPSER
jgi:CDP-diacylglycerol--glycerol-3-phosphate 3-phosphatidyltransferase